MLIDKKINKNRKKTKKNSVKISTEVIIMFTKCKFKICSIKIKKIKNIYVKQNKKYINTTTKYNLFFTKISCSATDLTFIY